MASRRKFFLSSGLSRNHSQADRHPFRVLQAEQAVTRFPGELSPCFAIG